LPDPIAIALGHRFALQGLASEPEIQLRIFGPLACASCELLEDFANARLAAKGCRATTVPQDRAIQEVVTACAALDPAARKCFSKDAMNDSGWSAVRRTARAALGSFGWPLSAPPFFVEVKPGHWARDDR
jgi:hypothetical protein